MEVLAGPEHLGVDLQEVADADRKQKRHLVELEEAGPRAAEGVGGSEGEFEGAAHEETAEDSSRRVAVLVVHQELVLRRRVPQKDVTRVRQRRELE